VNGAEEELAHRIAAARNKSHEGAASNTPFDASGLTDNEKLAHHRAFVGVWGEMHFARAFGLRYNFEIATKQYAGDGGIDFEVWIRGTRYTIDIKTSENPIGILVKKGDIERCADLLVLAGYNRKVLTFLGWDTAGIIAAMPIIEITAGYPNYSRPVSELRPMGQLVNFMAQRDAVRAA
jgi:hypothetical protein